MGHVGDMPEVEFHAVENGRRIEPVEALDPTDGEAVYELTDGEVVDFRNGEGDSIEKLLAG